MVARWGRLLRGGSLPVGARPGQQIRRVTPRVGMSTRGVTLAGSAPTGGFGVITRTPQEGFLRGGWLRAWWRSTPGLETTSTGGFTFPAGSPRGVSYFARVVTLGTARRVRRAVPPRGGRFTLRVRRVAPPRGSLSTPRGVPRGGMFRKRHRREWSPVGVSRFQRWPQPFPSLLVGGGWSPWGVTLLNEATACGVPLLRLEGSDATPGGVLWNQDSRSLTGVVALVDHLWGRSFRVSLLRTLWGRLSLV